MKKVGDKRAISAVVATVLIILVTVVAVTIIWTAIIPLVKNNLDTQDFSVDLAIDTSQGYTVYDEANGLLSVQVKRGADTSELSGLQVVVLSEGNSKSYVFKDVPSANQAKVYDLFLKKGSSIDSVSVAPLDSKGEVGSVSSEVVNIPSAEMGEVSEDGEGDNLYTGLVSYWGFDRGGFEEVQGLIPVVNGGPDCDRQGVSGNACFFELAENDSFTYPEYDFNHSTGPFSFSLWMNPDYEQEEGYKGVWGSGNYGPLGNVANNNWVWQLRYGNSSNKADFYLGIQFRPVTGSSKWVKLSEKVPIKKWSLITVIYNGTHGKIYFNGVLKDTTFIGSLESYVTLPNMIIGHEGWGPAAGTYFTGGLDEFGIWNRALTESEVEELHNSY